MDPPVADDVLRRNLSDIGCPYGVMAMTPTYNQQVWNDPDGCDDDAVVPALAGDSSDDELGMEIEEQATHTTHANEFDTDDELGFDGWYGKKRGTCRGEADGGCLGPRPRRGIR